MSKTYSKQQKSPKGGNFRQDLTNDVIRKLSKFVHKQNCSYDFSLFYKL